jgi:hypothetical protein
MVMRNKCYNTCFYLHDRFCIRKLFLVRHDTLRRLRAHVCHVHLYIYLPTLNKIYLLTYIHLKIWMHEIFFLSDILFTNCYFTCTCLVLEISLFWSIILIDCHNVSCKHRSKSFSYLAFRFIYGYARVYVRCHGGQEHFFEYKNRSWR